MFDMAAVVSGGQLAADLERERLGFWSFGASFGTVF